MTAKIAGFVTRAGAGLRPATSVSHRITPENGGVALHYGGPPTFIREHADCARTWRAWQAFHIDAKGWVDVAYTGAFCQHGYAFAGRGAGVRTAAQGTNDGNQNFYAVVWLGGAGQVPTVAALNAAEWWVTTLRAAGAGDSVVPHSFFHSTSCPGPQLTVHAGGLSDRRIDQAPLPAPVVVVTPPAQEDIDMQLRLDPDGETVWSVSAHAIRHVPNQWALKTLREQGLVPTAAPKPITAAELHALRQIIAQQDRKEASR